MPPGVYARRPAIERFLDKIEIASSGCWLWLARKNPRYGRFNVNKREHYAHRWSYEYFVGPIPAEMEIDHLCEVTACVNPDHLEPVTPLTNVNRSSRQNATKTHCPAGHPYDEKNTYVLTTAGRRGRYCRACDRARQRAARRLSWVKELA